MKLLTKQKAVLLSALIVLIVGFLRYAAYEFPSWAGPVCYPLIFIMLISEELFDSFLLLEVLLLLAAIGLAMLIPEENRKKRYLIRPVLCAALVIPMSLGIMALDEGMTAISLDRKAAKADALIGQADEILYYELNNHQKASQTLSRPEIAHSCGQSHNMILIDYDRHTVTFLRDLTNPAYLEIDTFTLKAVDEDPAPGYLQTQAALSAPGARLITYCPEEDKSHRTCAITLIMADGSIYSITDLKEPTSGFTKFLEVSKGEPIANYDSCPYGE